MAQVCSLMQANCTSTKQLSVMKKRQSKLAPVRETYTLSLQYINRRLEKNT